MFSLFRKKNSPPPAEATESASSDLTLETQPVEIEAVPPVEEEPLMTWEELDALHGNAASTRPRRRAAANNEASADSSETIDARTAPTETSLAPAAATMTEPPPERSPLEEALERLEANPHDVDTANEVARLAYANKQVALAIAPLMRAAMLLAPTEPSHAIDLLTRLAAMRGDNGQSNLTLFELCRWQNRHAEADQALRNILRRERGNLKILNDLAGYQLATRRYRPALTTLEEIRALDESDPVSNEKLGDAHALLNDVSKAVESWLAAAKCFAARGEDADAERMYDQVRLLDPSNAGLPTPR